MEKTGNNEETKKKTHIKTTTVNKEVCGRN